MTEARSPVMALPTLPVKWFARVSVYLGQAAAALLLCRCSCILKRDAAWSLTARYDPARCGQTARTTDRTPPSCHYIGCRCLPNVPRCTLPAKQRPSVAVFSGNQPCNFPKIVKWQPLVAVALGAPMASPNAAGDGAPLVPSGAPPSVMRIHPFVVRRTAIPAF